MTIKEGIGELKNELRFEKKNIVLIIIASLSAGHDLKSLKEKVRFVIETRGSQLANVAQGLPGRLCGYHKNRDLIIYANKNILELYSKFENDPETQQWVSGAFYKVICKVNEKEFENAKSFDDYVLLNESSLNNQEVALVFRPREEWPKAFRFYKLYK